MKFNWSYRHFLWKEKFLKRFRGVKYVINLCVKCANTPKCGIFEITGSCFLTLASTAWKGNGVSARREALPIVLDGEVTGSFPCAVHGCSSEANTFFDSLSTLTEFAVPQSVIIWTQMYVMSHKKKSQRLFFNHPALKTVKLLEEQNKKRFPQIFE